MSRIFLRILVLSVILWTTGNAQAESIKRSSCAAGSLPVHPDVRIIAVTEEAAPVPHCKVANHADVRDWLTAYARAGGPHHHAICFGDARPRLKLVAALLDADYCEV